MGLSNNRNDFRLIKVDVDIEIDGMASNVS